MIRLIEKAQQLRKQQIDQVKATRLILERNLTDSELSEYMNLFDNWVDIPTDKYIPELSYVKYGEALYKVLKSQGHNKEEGLNPEISTWLFERVTPNITPEVFPEVLGEDI